MVFSRILVAVLIADLVVPVASALGEQAVPGAEPAAAAPVAAGAGAPAVAAAAAPAPADAAAGSTFSVEQLEQIVAPIALYPDALLTQILMASTYPLEVIEAERWIKKNPELKDEALDTALAEKNWDPSVESLTHFPSVLTRMSENLDWTKDMGDAFLGQQKDVLAAVQRMRQKAYELGNLKSTPEQNVIVEPGAPVAGSQAVAGEAAPTQIIRVEPAQPTVVYVPTYSSTVVYGAPPPTMYYPAAYAYPPGYVATASLLSFGVGMAVGASLWGDCDWNSGDVDIDVDRNTNINNNNINRNNINRGNGNQRPQQWKHNPQHRGGVGYRNDAVAKKYGQPRANNRGANASARGYERPSKSQPRAATTGAGTSARGSSAAAPRGPGQQARAGQQPGRASAGSSNRAAATSRPTAGSRDTAFGGADSGRNQRAASQRGASSRGVDSGSFGRSGGGGSSFGGSRGGGGGGGGGFGGGGGRGGGGGGGRGGGGRRR